NFTNSGTIQSSNYGVNIENGAAIKTLTNSGAIQSSSNNAINVAADVNIKTLINESGGSIIASSASANAINFAQGTSTTIFKNEGTIQGGSNTASVNLGTNNQNGVTIETFSNSGIIGNGTS
ncbi:TPA: autotransporter, partial [Campylobacter jejuni]